MEDQVPKFNGKIIKGLLIIGMLLFGYFFVLGPYINRYEGALSFEFSEVPANQIGNASVIHLEDKDIMNVRGLDVIMQNGKISSIYFMGSQNPEISSSDFNQKYGSSIYDPSSRKILEYKGVYYIAMMYVT